VKINCRSISADDTGRFVAVSQWFTTGPPNPDQLLEFGVELLALPGLEPVRSFLIPGHEASAGALSPDGRLLALEATQTRSRGFFIAVFDTATGRELARRKSSGVYLRGIHFLPDNRTLAIPGYGHTPAEPVELWTIPAFPLQTP
jgi:hypothetical protein